MSFDPKCHELAEYFLPGTASDRLKKGLAQHVQDAVEDWFRTEADELLTQLERKPP